MTGTGPVRNMAMKWGIRYQPRRGFAGSASGSVVRLQSTYKYADRRELWTEGLDALVIFACTAQYKTAQHSTALHSTAQHWMDGLMDGGEMMNASF